MIDLDKLAGIMADFENGEIDGNSFDVEVAFNQPEYLQAIAAFAAAAARDTPPSDPEAYVIAGLLQGVFIGYEYAKREES